MPLSEQIKNRPNETLDDLARALLAAKRRERYATEDRKTLEHKIAEITGETETPEKFYGDEYDVIVRSNVVRSVDPLGITPALDGLGVDLASELFPLRHSLDLGAYLSLRNSDPEKFKIASEAVTVRHHAPTVTVIRRR